MLLPIMVALACAYGTWADEASNPNIEYRLLEPWEQQELVEKYHRESHDRIDWPVAYLERETLDGGGPHYSVVFVDDDGCLQFRLRIHVKH